MMRGAVDTRVTEAATEVSSSEASQVAKWTPRATPANPSQGHWAAVGRIPRRREGPAKMMAPPIVRQKARATGEASAHWTRTADEEMATMAIAKMMNKGQTRS